MRESTHAFGPDGGLIGTITYIERPANASLGLVLFNAGVVSRVGPHRINVKIARHLAGQGIPTVRFDLHGMGDSRRPDGRLSYKEQVVADLQAALNLLQQHAGVNRFAVLGFCSGALPSYWLARADERVRGIVLYDAFDFSNAASRRRHFWLRLRAHGFGPGALLLYARRGLSLVGALAQLVRQRKLAVHAQAAEVNDPEASITIQILADELAALTRRGVRVALLQSGNDFSNVNDAGQIAQVADPGGQRGLIAGFLPQIDHIMTSRHAQRAFIDWITDFTIVTATRAYPSTASASCLSLTPARSSALS